MNGLQHAVFLVEDNLDDELLTKRAASSCGVSCEIKVLRHGGDALVALLALEGPLPDLLVLDFHLPGKNGLEILRALRSNPRTSHLPIVMLSALESDAEFANCLAEGANSCVRKPMEPREYVDHVGLILRYWLTVDHRPASA